MSQVGIFLPKGGDTGIVETLTGNAGGAVGPSANNINVVGTGSITVTGNPGTNTLTISSTDSNIYIVQTLDNTPTPIFTQALAANQAITVFGTIVGARADYSAALSGTISGGARNPGTGTVMIPGPNINYSEDSGGAIAIDLAIVGNNVEITVMGEAATTYNWKAIVSYIIQS